MRFNVGLRSKVLAISSLLLLLPWFAYQFIMEIEHFLRAGQQQSLLSTTSAIATSLHERPELFKQYKSMLGDLKQGQDLYVYNLLKPMTLDGNNNDWEDIQSFKNVYPTGAKIENSDQISFHQMLGKQNGYLFSHIEVIDPSPVKRQVDNKKVTENDHLMMAISSPQGKLQRYIISVTRDGWFNAYRYPEHSLYARNLTREKAIQGIWKTTDKGYNIEFRMPLSLLGDKLGFQLNTVSDANTGKIDNSIHTSNLLEIDKLGSVLIPSPEIENILLAMRHTRSRLWVVDKHQRVIAKAGNIHQATGLWPTELGGDQVDSGIWASIEKKLLSPLYGLWLQKPDNTFTDLVKNSNQLNYPLIDQALAGQAVSQWQLTTDNKASILSAAHPIIVGNKVIGAIVAEETNQGILILANQAFQKMFNALLAVLLVVAIVLYLFLSTIVSRIRKLRDQSEEMIDDNGRLNDQFTASEHKDEIGDLSRSMQDMLQRLASYHHYVEQLSSRLSHELRTPVAVVRSSLENLASLPGNEQQTKYIARSQEGLQRLNKILTNMSEAGRLEQSLQQGEKQPLDLTLLLKSCLQGYEMIYPNTLFETDFTQQTLIVEVDPDFWVQMLDKIINNAIEFSEQGTPIIITLANQKNQALLTIENLGPLLATEQNQDLFQSMISIRPSTQQHESHLGLGLYIAKMICDYHQATLSIENNSHLTGVKVNITLPLILK